MAFRAAAVGGLACDRFCCVTHGRCLAVATRRVIGLHSIYIYESIENKYGVIGCGFGVRCGMGIEGAAAPPTESAGFGW